jgi:hypothetical protein
LGIRRRYLCPHDHEQEASRYPRHIPHIPGRKHYGWWMPRIISHAGAAPSYHDGMTTVPRLGREKTRRPYRVDVTRRHEGAEPFGWQVYRRGESDPIARSETGYADEAAAWNAGASAMQALERGKT